MLITTTSRSEGPGSASPQPTAAGSGAGAPQPARPGPARPDMATALRPLLIDVAAPLAAYFVLHNAAGLSVWVSLALSSIIPAVRAVAGIAADRTLNLLAALMLAVNVAGVAVSFWTGDPRMMIAKDAVISSVIGAAILISAALGRPLMTAALRPFLTRGDRGRSAAWDRLAAGSARFHRYERLFSAVWGLVLLADCAARLIGAFLLPVGTMAWLGTVFVVGAIVLASIVGGTAARPMEAMVVAEAC